jgi:hypothetical protein
MTTMMMMMMMIFEGFFNKTEKARSSSKDAKREKLRIK